MHGMSETGVPVVALQQFLAALRARDFVGAKKLAFRSELWPVALGGPLHA